MSRRSRFLIDISLLVGLLVANDPARTGLAIHEWLSIALVVPALVHLVVNWEWTLAVARRFFQRLMSVSRLNLVVDTALFASTVAVMISGLAVSSVLAGTLGIASAPSPLWVAVHALSASATIIALFVHFALHGTWFARTIASVLDGRLGSGSPAVFDARLLRNALSVLGATALLSATIFLTVSGTGALLGVDGSTASAATAISGTSTGLRTCPRTGCTASSCHAETGQSPYAQDNTGSGGGSSSGYSNSSSASGLRTCPRTGCTASTCHAETGRSPYAQ